MKFYFKVCKCLIVYLVNTVYTVSTVQEKLMEMKQSGLYKPFSGVLYAYITDFDVDGNKNIVLTRWYVYILLNVY